MQQPQPKTIEFHDIAYTELDHEKHKLDIYVTDMEEVEKKPVLFFVHGGGWKQGDRKWRNNFISGNLYGNVGKRFAPEGFVSVVISYRLSSLPHSTKLVASTLFGMLGTVASYLTLTYFLFSPTIFFYACPIAFLLCFFLTVYRLSEGTPTVRHPHHIQDIAKAYQWVTKNIHRYGGDEKQIYLMGHSAGAHLVTLLALDDTYLKEAGASNEGIKGVVGLSGVYNWGRLFKSGWFTRFWYISPVLGSSSPSKETLFHISPLTHVRKCKFPFFLVNASADLYLDRDASELKNALEREGVDVTSQIIQGTNHFTIISRINTKKDTISPEILKWLREQRLINWVQSTRSQQQTHQQPSLHIG